MPLFKCTGNSTAFGLVCPPRVTCAGCAIIFAVLVNVLLDRLPQCSAHCDRLLHAGGVLFGVPEYECGHSETVVSACASSSALMFALGWAWFVAYRFAVVSTSAMCSSSGGLDVPGLVHHMPALRGCSSSMCGVLGGTFEKVSMSTCCHPAPWRDCTTSESRNQEGPVIRQG